MTIPRIFLPDFQAAVARLRVPEMGTEVVAPLLANLVRPTRPRRVLEVGMGYTTPFLARYPCPGDATVDAGRRCRTRRSGPSVTAPNPLAPDGFPTGSGYTSGYIEQEIR